MNSPIKFLRRVRIHGGECGAVARALHHKAKFSSPAVFENVSSTTYERKQMTNKSISFKRVALALVAALGFGVLASGPSNAILSTPSTTLSLSASSATAAPGETVTVTATVNFTSTEKNESLNIVSNNPGSVDEFFQGLTTDSINVITKAQGDAMANLDYVATRATRFNVFGNTNPDSSVATATPGMYIYSNASDATPVAVQAKVRIVLRVASNATAGPIQYTFTTRTFLNSSANNYATAAFTLTVSADDTTASAAKSLIYLNNVDLSGAVGSNYTHGGLEADSTLVVSANTVTTGAQTYTAVAGIWALWKNAADTVVAGVAATRVSGSITLNVSGPGLLSKPDRAGGAGTLAKSVTLTLGETAIVYSDGTAGVGTITSYIGANALTQAAKTITFTGKAATLTAYETTVIQMGATSLSSNSADSVNVGNKVMYVKAVDTAANTVRSGALNTNGNLWCISSDTSVASLTTTNTPTDSAKPSTAGFVAATAPGASETFWTCNVRPLKEGSVTITLADDTVVATASISAAKTYTFAKSVGGTAAGFKGKGTISFDKATYNVGEAAVITVTVLNASGNVPGAVLTTGDAAGTVFTSLTQNRPFSSVGKGTGNTDLGFDTGRTGTTFTLTGGTFFKGVETYTVYMPATAGDVTITGFTTDGTYDTATAVSVTLKVVDPNAALIAASQAATVAAAEAATDAAAEAIDAANAATDAANLAAEAADAATVAAEEARDAADAATAAVEELATQVATLMAALKAQLTTLANTVAKIAKKVKA